MKPLKYTVAALAILAAASFTQSANAALTTGNLVLGIEDTDGQVANSYELSLGAFNSLSDGETFNLGTTVTSFFSSDSSATLQFNIAGTGGATTGGGGLSKQELAYTALTLPSSSLGLNVTPTTNIATEYTAFAGGTTVTLPSTTSSTGKAISAVSVANSTTGSFFFEFDPNGGQNGQYAIGDGTLGDAFPTSDVLTLYTNLNNSTSATAIGTFSLSTVSGNEILTFNALATPEPSAYALGLCAVALFFVLRRRSTVA